MKSKKKRAHKQVVYCSVGCKKPTVAKGLCDTCYRRYRKYGTTGTIKVPDLPGEEWRPIADCHKWYISNMGRVKSCRLKTREQLVKINFSKADGHTRCLNFRDRAAKGRTFRVHIEVLKAFVPNVNNDTRAVFKDGNIKNCKASNLAWYGENYMVPLAIKQAEKSCSEWASDFISFWKGDKNSLDSFWVEAKERVTAFLAYKLRMYGKEYLDIAGMAQEAMVAGFVGIKRGLVKDIDKVFSWFLSVASTVLSGRLRSYSKLPCVSLYNSGDRGDGVGFWSLADMEGYCNPSAEIVAIYNESRN